MNIKKYLKSKFSKDRMARFFDKEGFYIVLFLCVCVVAITAVWVSRTGVKNDPQKGLSEVEDGAPAVITPGQQTSANPNKDSELSGVVDDGKASEVNTDSAVIKEKQDDPAPSKTGTKTTPSYVSFGSPFKDQIDSANIYRDYSPEDLVCFKPADEWRAHVGLDIKSDEGTEVLAVGGGKVIDVRNDNDFEGGLGWTVVIDHNNGYRSVYSNLDEALDVKKNQAIKEGQRIGMIGKSSIYEQDTWEDAPAVSHLHIEILRNNSKSYENVDPKEYLMKQE